MLFYATCIVVFADQLPNYECITCEQKVDIVMLMQWNATNCFHEPHELNRPYACGNYEQVV